MTGGDWGSESGGVSWGDGLADNWGRVLDNASESTVVWGSTVTMTVSWSGEWGSVDGFAHNWSGIS